MFQFSMGYRCNKRQVFDQSRLFIKPDNTAVWETLNKKGWMNECIQALGKNNNPLVVVFQTYCKRLSPSPAAVNFLFNIRIKKVFILYVLEKTSIKQIIKGVNF